MRQPAKLTNYVPYMQGLFQSQQKGGSEKKSGLVQIDFEKKSKGIIEIPHSHLKLNHFLLSQRLCCVDHSASNCSSSAQCPARPVTLRLQQYSRQAGGRAGRRVGRQLGRYSS